MRMEKPEARSEREQTDESLRLEREKADDALAEQLRTIDETADEVITRARARADEVLAAARAKTDRQSATSAATHLIERDRHREDIALLVERASADDTLSEERAEHAALLSSERGETDKDLLTERTRADSALATRDDFLGVVSHDLRDMLAAMVSFAALIEKRVARDNPAEEVRAHAQRIQRSGARMNRLIGDLIDVASIEAGLLGVSPQVADPTHVVTEAVETFQALASAAFISLTAELVPPSSLAAFDSARILQVLSNLLSNAIKFTPANGRVVVRVERVGDDILFAVSDTGAGIPKNKLEAVFERFFQLSKSDRRGVGLGLYISQCIVRAHGGKMWPESTVGEGSTFYFTVPTVGRCEPKRLHEHPRA
jgi:signal transduction histidine kinase